MKYVIIEEIKGIPDKKFITGFSNNKIQEEYPSFFRYTKELKETNNLYTLMNGRDYEIIAN